MADILKVIQDVIKMDAHQKREEKKIMREVEKRLKDKEVSEEEGDKEEYTAFVNKMLKKFGVKSPAELKGDAKKKFYDALDAGWEGDDEKPEPEDEEIDLGDRVKARMKSEQEDEEEDEEDEDEAPVGDQDEPDTEPEAEPDPEDVEGEKLDKLADLVIQKLKDKQSEEEDEEEEPEPTEAESGKKEKIDTKPTVEHLNPHRRSVWEEALRKVHEEKVPQPIPTIIKSVGKQLKDYAKERGGIDRDDFMTVANVMLQGKIPKKTLIPKDTDPREFVHDIMAKTFGWKFVEQEYGITFTRRRDYVESFQGGHKLEEHCGMCDEGGEHGFGEFEALTDIIKVLQERPEFSNFIPLDRKFYETFAKKAKKAGLKWDTFEKYVKGTFKDNADKSKALLFAKDVFKESVEIEEAKKSSKKFKAQCQECGKKFSTASMIPYCPRCNSSDIDLAEEIVREEWIDDEARKVEHKWKSMSKQAKVKWRAKIDDMAAKHKMADAELEDVLDDYGLKEETSNLQKLEDWGVDVKKEGYMIMPGIDREKYTEIRGMEGPFMTRSGKVLYYDPKAGEYYDRDSDIYLSYAEYMEHDKESSAQRDAMAKGVFDDPKSREYKSMIRIKKKSEKAAQKAARKYSYESVGMSFARKHYQKDKD